MSVEFSVEVEKRSLRRTTAELLGVRDGMPRAISGTIKRSTNTVRSRTVRALARNLGVKNSDIYKRGASRRPVRQFTTPQPLADTGHIQITGKRLPLSRFKPRQTAQGVSYKVDRRGRRRVEGSFLLRTSSGHLGVFRRRGPKSRKLVELFGPSVPHVAQNDDTVKNIVDVQAPQILEKNLASQVDRLLSRRRR